MTQWPVGVLVLCSLHARHRLPVQVTPSTVSNCQNNGTLQVVQVRFEEEIISMNHNEALKDCQ